MNVGETKQLGPYVVRATLRHDNPAFPRYLIFKGEELIGKQFSDPCLSDCQWHEYRNGQYARQEESKKDRSWELRIPKRGRPSKAVLALRQAEAEALSA